MTLLRIGIIGNGAIARYYLAAIEQSKNFQLVSVCDTNPTKLIGFPNMVDCYTDYHDMLGTGSLDAVIINVSNDQHYSICKDAISTKVHVCCEKPLTIHLWQARKLSEMARNNDVVLFTAFHRRYNKNYLKIKQRTNGKSIKKVTINYLENIIDHFGNEPWYLQPTKCGGGCIIDNGSNAFDLVVDLLGPMYVLKSCIKRDDNIDVKARIYLCSEQKQSVEINLDWRYERGEKKDAYVFLDDGQILYFDMLRGFPEFKSSLYHEYVAILNDFMRKIKQGHCFGEEGLTVAGLVEDSYSMPINCSSPRGDYDED